MGGTLSTLYDPLEEADELAEHIALDGVGGGTPEPRLIEYADLAINPRQIGKGSFADVYSAKWNGIDVAVKKFKVSVDGQPQNPLLCGTMAASWVRKEVRMLELINGNCDKIVTYYGICENPPCIVTELCHRGSLHAVLKTAINNPSGSLAAALNWKKRLEMALDVAQGMAYLHSRNILHRDLKSPNLFVTRDFKLKIGDLGLGKLVEDGASILSASIGEGMAVPWMAPERLNLVPTEDGGSQITKQAEVYSYGVVLWELLTWKMPWGDLKANQIAASRGAGNELGAPDFSIVAGTGGSKHYWPCYDAFECLVKSCLERDPKERPTFQNIVNLLECFLDTLAAGSRDVAEVQPPPPPPPPLRPASPPATLPRQLSPTNSIDLGLINECTEAFTRLISAFKVHRMKTQQVAEQGLLSAVVDVLHKISASIPAESDTRALRKCRKDLIEYDRRAQKKLHMLRAGQKTGWSDADPQIIRSVAEGAYGELKKAWSSGSSDS